MDIENLLKKPGIIDQIHRDTGRSRNSIIYWGRRHSVPAKFLPAVSSALGLSIDEVIAACSQASDLYPPSEDAA